jgi:hypothetical protein
MPGDPHECRRHALNCVKLAEKAVSAADREHLLNLAKTWRQLAGELEATRGLLNSINGIEMEAAPEKAEPKLSPLKKETPSEQAPGAKSSETSLDASERITRAH